MPKKNNVTSVLIVHFFRRFFDNDTIQVDGDTLTTVVRAISVVAIPGLMVAFFLQNQYPRRSLWGSIEDQYFFVLFSFIVMGAVSIFEWEMLFPDRQDFLILSPLSLKPKQMLTAKAAALIAFLGLFLVSCNLFGTLVLPAVTRHFVTVNGHLTVQVDFYRQVYAHGAAVFMAGIFAATFFLALGGVLLCVLGAARFRMVSPIMQMLSITALALMLMQYAQFGDSMQALLSKPLGAMRWMPPLWFLGIYEQLLHGDAAPAFAREMSRFAIRGTAIAVAVTLLTYPLAWARMRRMAIEGISSKRRKPSRWLAALIHSIVRRPGERAVFHFIGQTIARNNRYQIYLAMYGGTGLALAIACAVTYPVIGDSIHPALSNKGLHAVMPLLLFWVIAGLRTAFAFPLNLAARWVFRITGVNLGECTAAAHRWVLLCATGVAMFIVVALHFAGWDTRQLLVQAVCGLCLCILLTDGFFFFLQSVPFNQPRMPGRTSFPLMLTLYVGVLPPFIFGVIYTEMQMERNLGKLLLLTIITAAIHVALQNLRKGYEEIEEEMEGYDGEFQLLGLSWR
ncbi:hypothetical protein [Edaphobacter dinghuensis]|uniref:Uncharacterized protein n=1 Tax=Edaphobacter dinghuensis TaxID=1560005 RepID=A0A917M5U2_9BACT|nr:hypothetical protein [Edaphobacter dinghuensis]GGG76913.1 hypothetical protein GCM10011585_19890 [Edaphobacter dinghuensis]